MQVEQGVKQLLTSNPLMYFPTIFIVDRFEITFGVTVLSRANP